MVLAVPMWAGQPTWTGASFSTTPAPAQNSWLVVGVLLHSEQFDTRREAMSREWHLKRDRKFRRSLSQAQVPFAKDDNVVQAIAPDRSDQPLRDSDSKPPPKGTSKRVAAKSLTGRSGRSATSLSFAYHAALPALSPFSFCRNLVFPAALYHHPE